jgi:sigma-B regulation protein RsbU (phosphoserine phosphatase)
MTMTLSVIRAHALEGLSPVEILRRSNNVLTMRNERCTFVTLFCGILDTVDGRVAYANGGHNPPLVLNGHGGVRFLEQEGVALGAMEDMPYVERDLVLDPGQGLFLYTDGVTEANNSKEELFEEDRLEQTLRIRHTAFTSKEITIYLRKALADFVQEAAQSDDITALTLFYRGTVFNRAPADEEK